MIQSISRRKFVAVVIALTAMVGGTLQAFASDTAAAASRTPPSSAEAALSTSYATPTGAIIVSTSGSDSNTGSAAAPLRTITKAISVVPPWGTVVVHGGVYREGSSSSIRKSLTLQNYPGEQVWMDGTDVVTAWSTDANAWVTSWSTPSFCSGGYYNYPYLSQASNNSGPCTHKDMAWDPSNLAAGDPQMAFVNGAALKEVTSRSAVGVGSFFYDQSARKLYMGTNPNGAKVELTARPTALVLEGGNGFTLRGIGFTRFASNEFDGNRTHGAVLVNSPNVIMDNLSFTFNAAAGLSVSNPHNASLTNSFFGSNGFNGLDANGSYRTGGIDNMVVTNNMFDGNNTELFGTGCNLSCATAGSKMAHMNGLLLKGNIFQNSKGVAHGYWCDLACSNVTIVDNIFRNNGGHGVYYEVSNTGIIASNLVESNGGYGIKVGAANTQIYNNTVLNNRTNVLIYDDSRSLNVGGWTDVGPDTTNVSFVNNLVSGGTSGIAMSLWRTSPTAYNTGPSTFIKGLDNNTYYRPNNAPATLVDWREGASTEMTSLAAVRARGFERNGIEAVSNPVSKTGIANDISGGAVAAVPADVAAAIGVSSSSITRRGAVSYPGAVTAPIVTTTTMVKPTTATAKPTTPTSAPTTTTAKPTGPPVTSTSVPAPVRGTVMTDGFESGATAWHVFGSSTLSVATATKRTGSDSLRIDATKANTIVGAINVAVQSTVAGKTYTGSCWVKSQSVLLTRVRFQEYNQGWKRIADPVDSAAVSTAKPSDWYQISVSFTAPRSGELLPFSVYSTGQTPSSHPLSVDDCTITASLP